MLRVGSLTVWTFHTFLPIITIIAYVTYQQDTMVYQAHKLSMTFLQKVLWNLGRCWYQYPTIQICLDFPQTPSFLYWNSTYVIPWEGRNTNVKINSSMFYHFRVHAVQTWTVAFYLYRLLKGIIIISFVKEQCSVFEEVQTLQ